MTKSKRRNDVASKTLLAAAKWLEETNPINGEQELRDLGLIDAAETCKQRRNGFLFAIEWLKKGAANKEGQHRE